jgi:sugar lactone lactonase YvrE
VTVTVNFQAAGAVANVQILTLGASGLDFASGPGSSCLGANRFANQTCQQSVVFTPATPGVRLGTVVLLDSDNKVLGTTYLSGTGQGGLGVLVPGNTVTVAGSYRAYTSAKDGILATSANLWEPLSVAFDGTGNMYVADTFHNKVRIVAPPVGTAVAGIISTFAGTGNAGSAGDGGLAKNADLNSPSGVAVDGAGNVYIADAGNNRIRKVSPGGMITTVAGNLTAGFAGDNQAADSVNTQFNNPVGVTVDSAGNLYIADNSNQRIRRIDAATGIITTVAGNGASSGLGDGYGTYSGDDGPATSAALSLPYTVAFDASGNMFIPDSTNHCIRRVDGATEIITTVAGTGGKSGYKGDGAAATAALLDSPSGVAVDPAGNLYIADTANAAIRKVNFTTGRISTLVMNGQGNSLPPPSLGSLGPVLVYAPVGLYLDGKGNLYFADRYNMMVRVVESNAGVLNFITTPVFLGQQSTTSLVQTVENDGNAPLNLTLLSNDQNAVIDPATTTCNLTNPVLQDATCNIGAFFAPATSVVIPAGKSQFQVNGNVNAEGTTPNSPLDVIVAGTAAPTNATELVLSSSPASPVFGQNVTVKATVTSASAAPTGTVAFTFDGTATVPASINVSSAGANTAVATYTTTSPLAVGVHAIDASFTAAKNTDFLPGDGAMSVEVDLATGTALTSSVSGGSATLGSTITFTAQVSANSAAGVVPDGTITFYDGATIIGGPVGIDARGVATFATNSLPVGSHSIAAIFSGDLAKYILGSRTASTLKLDVQGTSTISLNSSPNPSVYGTPVTFAVSIASTSGTAATGSVTLLDGTTQIGTATLSGNSGAGSFTTSALTAGSHSISASYAGDQNNGSSYTSTAQVVNLAATTTSLTATPNPGIAGHAVTLVAAVKLTVGSRVPTGTVTFTDASSTTLGAGKVGSDGTGSISVVLKPGAHAIAAAYSGDANAAPSLSNNLPLEVNLATTKVAVTSSGSPIPALAAVTFTAVVTGNGGTPTGSVVFSIDGAAGNPVVLDTSGKATYSTSSLVVGNHIVAATYLGDVNDNGSAATGFTQVIQAIPTSTRLGTSSTGGDNPQTILVATVTATNGPVPTGTVIFMNGSTTIGAAPLDSNGVATLMPDLAPATYNITAQYSGDSVHGSSTSSAVEVSGIPTGFGMTINPTEVTLASTQNTNVTLTFKSSNGYADTIGLGCGTLPMGVNCHFANESVALKAGATASIQLTIDTNTPLGGGSTAVNAASRRGGFSLAGLFVPAGLMLGWIGWRFRKRNAAIFTALLVLALSSAMLVTGCGAFSQKSAVPGTYTIQVTGVGTNSNITHYQTITLTITK